MEEVIDLFVSSIFYGLTAGFIIALVASVWSLARRIMGY